MRARSLLLVIAIAAASLAGCLGGGALEESATAGLPRTPENFVVLNEWDTITVEPRTSYEFPFTVPAGLRTLDLDTRVMIEGGTYPTVRFYYVTPSGEDVAATAQQGSGLNGRELAAPDAGEWVLHIEGAENPQEFRIRMWLYGCEENVECRVFVPPRDEHGH